jgi:4-carboxymuconolactone decarboxylase
MNNGVTVAKFHHCLDTFRPHRYSRERSLALYSAAIALSDETVLDRTVAVARQNSVTFDELHEVVLQSYLFLGFPRMLAAAEHLGDRESTPVGTSVLREVSSEESKRWFTEGLLLCRQVYADKYPALKRKVESLSPEIFRWMVIEGYGKVLSRPGLDIVTRELAVIACLMVDNRRQQLLAHIRGALNVGASAEVVDHVINDLGEAAGEGYTTALSILEDAR